MAVTVTVEDGTGVAGANSYASVAQADSYFGNRPRSTAWTALADDDAKGRYLIHATTILDAAVRWDGDKVAEDQALQFPRVIDDENVELPVEIVTALYELTLALIGRDLTAEPGGAGYKRIEVGPIELETDFANRPATIPSFVRNIIADFGVARGALASIPLVRA